MVVALVCSVMFIRMEAMEESDEELFITQRRFRSESSILESFNLFDDLGDTFVENNTEEDNLGQARTDRDIFKRTTDERKTESRGTCVVNDDKLERRKESRILGNMKASTRWAVNTWCEWAV